MPEGPEIRLAADRIADKLVNRVAEEVSFGLPKLVRFGPRLSGQRIGSVETRGKAMLIHFDNDLTLYSHNQLYGRWYVRARDSYPKTNRSLRVAIHTEQTSALLYSASEIAVLDASGVTEHPFLRRIGPDLLDPALTPQRVVARLRDARFRNRAVGGLYLDQGFIAGVGNYLRSEILHFAGVHPKQKPSELSAAVQRKLAKETVAVGQRAYLQRGVTNTPSRVLKLKKLGLTRRRYRHAVFARAGEPCYRCSSRVEKTSVAARRLYYCPACQGV